MAMEVRNNTELSRYELEVDGELVGIADYRVDGTAVVFPHTEIRPSLRGQGLAAALIRAALDETRAAGQTVVPQCSYVADFIASNPEYRDLVAA
jgi:predicted GNAT family acetyltransferase